MTQKHFSQVATAEQLRAISALDAEATANGERVAESALSVRKGLGVWGLATLGATNMGYVGKDKHGFAFLARILPFGKSGVNRLSKPEKMLVVYLPKPQGNCDVVAIRKDGAVHSQFSIPSATSAQNAAYALDYDGETALNPRYS